MYFILFKIDYMKLNNCLCSSKSQYFYHSFLINNDQFDTAISFPEVAHHSLQEPAYNLGKLNPA